jgi:hypothetical protein
MKIACREKFLSVLVFFVHSLLFPRLSCSLSHKAFYLPLFTSRTNILAELVKFVIMGDDSARKPLKLISQELQHGWSFRQTDSSENDWYPVHKIPSVVHLDLMQNNLYVQCQVTRGSTKTRLESQILSLG